MQKVIDTMIVTMYVIYSLLAIYFILYAGYCLIQFENITAITSICAAIISFALSVFTAKVYEL